MDHDGAPSRIGGRAFGCACAGARIFTPCGNTFRASASQDLDLRYFGSLGDAVVWISDNQSSGRVVAIPHDLDTTLSIYEDVYLNKLASIPLPRFLVGQGPPGHIFGVTIVPL